MEEKFGKRIFRLNERGYLMVEVIAVAFLVVVAAAAIVPFKLMARTVDNNRAVTAADYLAQAEISYLLADNAAIGNYGWLGESSWLEQNGIRYEVKAAVAADAYDTRKAKITVSWTDGDKRKAKTVTRYFN